MQGLQLDQACCKLLPWWTVASRQGEHEGTQAGKPTTQKSQIGCYSVNNNSFSPSVHSPRHSGQFYLLNSEMFCCFTQSRVFYCDFALLEPFHFHEKKCILICLLIFIPIVICLFGIIN